MVTDDTIVFSIPTHGYRYTAVVSELDSIGPSYIALVSIALDVENF